MWKPEHRVAADRSRLRYPSDLTDAEWPIVQPLIPPARHGGPKRSVDVREKGVAERPATEEYGLNQLALPDRPQSFRRIGSCNIFLSRLR